MTEYTQNHPRRYVRDMAVEDRPLSRLELAGATALSTAELLASLLQTHDALDLALELLNTFGSLAGVARATKAELCQVRGVGEGNYGRIKAALELGRRWCSSSQGDRPRVSTPADAANLLMSEMSFLEREELRVILLSTRNDVLAVRTIYAGSVNSVSIRVAEVLRPAVRENAPAIIVVHNHPSGDPSPSPEDIRVTRQLTQAGKTLDIDVLDHVIIGRQRYASLKERGLGFD